LSSPLATIIILNYNGGNHVVECLESIFSTRTLDFELIFIDNNSSDGSQDVCREKFPQMRFVQNTKNEGMSARNIGLKSAQGKYIVFLDSDTIVTPNWLENFVSSFEKHGDGLYGPKILKKGTTNVIETVGNMINVFGLGYAAAKGQTDEGKYNEFRKISYPAGACVFSSKEVFDKIGLVDELFFAYHDDVDYGWRGLLLGIPSFYEPDVCIYHLSSPTLGWSKRKYFLLERNRWICLLSLYSTRSLLKLLPSLILVEAGIFFYMVSKGMGITKIQALFSLIRLSPEIREKHLKTNAQRRQSDKKVLESFADDFVMPTFTTTESTSKFSRFFVYKLSKIARRVI
jgi:GT2 family glycosyltransferase